jgi:hypothetical protein
VREQKDARPRVDALTAPTSNREHLTEHCYLVADLLASCKRYCLKPFYCSLAVYKDVYVFSLHSLVV